MAFKKGTIVLTICIFASLLSLSSAGRDRKLLSEFTIKKGEISKKIPENPCIDEAAALVVRYRILAVSVKTNDYGSFDPAPTFAKPRFKNIPN